ncbi:hypothetical protein JD516_13280 [Aeromonas jandaei]|uniref:hypothetical protein n=1 Tax=Aeromonas jandaei TaxID=650 RepID=UPI00191FCBAA|nr:hypothetical protein [Aeromonas jandaei]MBL0598782.1 hypothetical protein [Aeromonas jandaei]
MKLEVVSVLVAIVSLLFSIIAVISTYLFSKDANTTAREALSTARQANEISLGLVREPAILEFAFLGNSQSDFDFTDHNSLKSELKYKLTLLNGGQTSIDAVAIELIGIDGLTERLLNPEMQFKSLPSYPFFLNFRELVQPKSLTNIDFRKYLLTYLSKLGPVILETNDIYSIAINVVLSPKSTNESTPSSAGSKAQGKDRKIIMVKFLPSILDSIEAKAILNDDYVAHRVYTY